MARPVARSATGEGTGGGSGAAIGLCGGGALYARQLGRRWAAAAMTIEPSAPSMIAAVTAIAVMRAASIVMDMLGRS